MFYATRNGAREVKSICLIRVAAQQLIYKVPIRSGVTQQHIIIYIFTTVYIISTEGAARENRVRRASSKQAAHKL
jgi:hypothetical protein